MLTFYLKQAWELLRQNRRFSAIYIAECSLLREKSAPY